MALRLSVPFHKQNAVGYCLPACVQMVLAYQQIFRPQDELAKVLGLREGFGAPARSVRNLASDDLRIAYGEGTLEGVREWLNKSLPVIAFVQSGELTYWQGESFQHAVVVIGLDEHTVWLLDPDQDSQAIGVSVNEFLLAWLSMDYLYTVIYRDV